MRAGMTLGSQADDRTVRRLLRSLHPRMPVRPLVRLGGANDGGYLLPDDLDGIVACFSPGVGTVATFEEDLVKRGIPCFLADGSVRRAPITHELITFERVSLGVVNNGTVTTMDDWVNRHVPAEGDLLLQMDVDGGEWPVLLNTSEQTLQRFRIIVLEMHDLDRLIDKVGFTLIGNALIRLLRDFVTVHIHPNNSGGLVAKKDIVLPRVMEATFLRKDRQVSGYCTQFPHPLDMPNIRELPDIVLPEIWRQIDDSLPTGACLDDEG
jgi:Methyltransferase FkbM domain